MAGPARAPVPPLTAEERAHLATLPLDKKAGFVKISPDTASAVTEATSALSSVAAKGSFRGAVSFNIVTGDGRTIAYITTTPSFIDAYWAELRAAGGWFPRGVRIAEIVQERPLERRTNEPAPAAAAGVPSENIWRRHAPRNTAPPSRVGIVSGVAAKYGATLENVARASAKRRAPPRGVNLNTLLRASMAEGSEYTPEAAHAAARLMSERLTTTGGRRRTIKNRRRR